jgi:hypothetical protein
MLLIASFERVVQQAVGLMNAQVFTGATRGKALRRMQHSSLCRVLQRRQRAALCKAVLRCRCILAQSAERGVGGAPAWPRLPAPGGQSWVECCRGGRQLVPLHAPDQWLTLTCCGLLKGTEIGCPAKQPTTALPAHSTSSPACQAAEQAARTNCLPDVLQREAQRLSTNF